ncbi:MAG: glycosyltransferase [Alphaproteobacteria bacterium]|nr:glycosyltransferase [Alphaproteobacteria bacterium]
MRRPRPLRTDAAAAVGPPGSRRLSASVVIPTLNDGDRLARCLAPLASGPRRGLNLEVLVVDGGSTDDTATIAEAHGARVLAQPGPRGARFATGAKAAIGEWLILLRPETALEPGWDATLMVFASEERNRERGAVYSFTVEADAVDQAAARRAQRWMRIRNRWLGLPSGAQGMVIRRRFLVHLGGIPPLDWGEDLVLARRLGLGRLSLFDVGARVRLADRPYGLTARFLGALRLMLFLLRVPPRWLRHLGG